MIPYPGLSMFRRLWMFLLLLIGAAIVVGLTISVCFSGSLHKRPLSLSSILESRSNTPPPFQYFHPQPRKERRDPIIRSATAAMSIGMGGELPITRPKQPSADHQPDLD